MESDKNPELENNVIPENEVLDTSELYDLDNDTGKNISEITKNEAAKCDIKNEPIFQ